MAARAGKQFLLLCTASKLLMGAAFADDAVNPPAAPGIPGIEEITVTAEKRTENLREVPQSISVVTGTQLQQQHIDDYADLARTVPDLSFTDAGGPGLSNLEIRGISSTVGTSTVSIYLDDAPVTIRNNAFYSGQTEPLFFDIAQTEVLRGPQGTLYGASALGGTIRLVSNPVNLTDYEGNAYSELSGTEHGGINYVERAIVNVPLVPGVLGLRLGGETTEDSGFVDHATNGVIDRTGINGDHANVLKANLLYQPVSKLTIEPSVFLQRTNIDDTGLVDLATPNYTTSKEVPEGGHDSLAVAGIKASYDLDWADLTSVTNFTWREFPRDTDGTFFNSEFVGGFVDSLGLVGLNGQLDGNVLSALPGPVHNSLNTRQTTQEIRLVSKPYDPNAMLPISWIAGLYYANSLSLGTSAQYIPGFNAKFLQTYGITAESFFDTSIPNDLFFQFFNRLSDVEYAAFGEMSYHFSPALTFTAGLRYLYGRDSETDAQSGFFASVPMDNGNTKAYAATPKFSLTYDVDPDLTTYATAGKGFRLGGLNSPVPAVECAQDLAAFGLTNAPPSYQPDKLWNYEVGAKGRFLDNSLSVNVSAYDIEWDKIQLDVPLKTCGFDFTDNVGHARSLGLETEILQRLGSGFTVGVSGQYDHDTFTQNVPGLGVNVGDPVPGSPKWSIGLTGNYEFDVTSNIGGFVRTNWQFIGNSHGAIIRDNPDYDRPSYNLLGGSAGVNFGGWEVSLFVKNLLDANKIIQRPADNFVQEGYTPVPRIIGVAVSAKF